MKKQEIKKKSISGLKWTFLLSILALPIGYITNLILGKVSPEILGIYSLVWVFDSFVNTFVLFGGGNVVIKYLPEIDKSNKMAFIITYLFIIISIMIITIGILLMYPNILNFLFGANIPNYIINYLIILMPIIILYYFFDYILNGLMEIKISVFLRQIIIFGNFISFSILFIFYRQFFVTHSLFVIGLYAFFYIVLTLLGFLLTSIKLKSKNIKFINIKKFKLYLPINFWNFAIFVQLSTILVFAFDKLDQLLVLNNFGLNHLGYYFAALQTAMLIRFVPILIGNVLLPTFSNLFVLDEIDSIKNGYLILSKYSILITVLVGLFCISFSKQIMNLFGQNFVNYYVIIIIIGFATMMSSMGSINFSITVAKGKARANFINSLIQILIQIIFMIYLMSKYGIIGIAMGKAIGVIVAQLGLFYITKTLNIGLKITNEYFISMFISIFILILYFLINPTNYFSSISIFVVSSIIFIYLGNYRLKDLKFLLNHFNIKGE